MIIAIDLADSRLEKALEFGADVTINSARQDALEAVKELTGGAGVDLAVEAVGVPETFELCTELIRPGGQSGERRRPRPSRDASPGDAVDP